MRAADIVFGGAGAEAQDVERLLARHGAAGGALAVAARHVLPPGGMRVIEVSLQDLRRLRIGKAAVLPEVRHLDGCQAFEVAASEEALQHATLDAAAI